MKRQSEQLAATTAATASEPSQNESEEELHQFVSRLRKLAGGLVRTTERIEKRASQVSEGAESSLDAGKAGAQVIAQAIASIETLSTQLDIIATDIAALAEQAGQLSDIVATVKEISEQTHLLALNATLESVRTSHEGAGCGVVAAEIRVLADQSRDAVIKVRQGLEAIQRGTEASVAITKNGAKTMGNAVSLVRQSGNIIENLSQMLNDATHKGKQIETAIGRQGKDVTAINESLDYFSGSH